MVSLNSIFGNILAINFVASYDIDYVKTSGRSRVELGQMVLILKYSDTTRYLYQTFKVLKYQLDLNSLCRDFRI